MVPSKKLTPSEASSASQLCKKRLGSSKNTFDTFDALESNLEGTS